VNHLIWHLFLETGNIETYLLLKSIENEPQVQELESLTQQEIASYQTKL
jgi:hypothetical protein